MEHPELNTDKGINYKLKVQTESKKIETVSGRIGKTNKDQDSLTVSFGTHLKMRSLNGPTSQSKVTTIHP